MRLGRALGASIGAVFALLFTACDPFAHPDLSSRNIDAGEAAQAIEQRHIALPDGYEFAAGRIHPVAFAGRPGYDLLYDAPAVVFEDPRRLQAAYTGTSLDGAFSEFEDVDCAAGIFGVAREQGWMTCTPQTKAKFSVTGTDRTNSARPFYYDGIAIIAAEGRTHVIVVIDGS